MRRLVLALVLAGCATPYQRKGALGGYEDFELGPDTHLITVEVTYSSGMDTAQAYLVRRARELCPYGYDVLSADARDGSGYYTVSSGIAGEIKQPHVSAAIRCHAASSEAGSP